MILIKLTGRLPSSVPPEAGKSEIPVQIFCLGASSQMLDFWVTCAQ
uniref:ATP binding protein n=1 Tax=Rhizophora mucronata TaxID=61149 RepID=A0A2P2JJM6_RHIMU